MNYCRGKDADEPRRMTVTFSANDTEAAVSALARNHDMFVDENR